MYYKVVFLRGGVNVGASVYNPPSLYSSVEGEAEVKYTVNEWVKAPGWLRKLGYGLLVFNDIVKAKNYQYADHRYTKLYECEIKNEMRLPVPLVLPVIEQGKVYWDVSDWENKETWAKDVIGWSGGTVMAEEVKLTKYLGSYNINTFTHKVYVGDGEVTGDEEDESDDGE